MKKLVWLLLAALLLTACGGPAGSKDPASDGKLRLEVLGEEVAFSPWEQDGLPAEGSYFLTKDVVLDAPSTVSGQLKLHLNGHTVTGAEGVQFGSVITVPAGGELVLCDAEGGAGRVLSPRSYPANPTVVSLFTVGGTVTVAGGTVDASVINLEDVGNGAGFHVQAGGVLNIAGGAVIGGTTWCSALEPPASTEQTQQTEQTETAETTEPTESTEPTEATEPAQEEEKPFEILGKGGSVYVAGGGVCNISGGEVRQGSAGLGGNLFVEPEGQINITGGRIVEGEAVFHGGNAYISGCLNMSAGEIALGGSYSNGGNLFIEGTLEMTGGVIAEGTCDVNTMAGKRGGNICVSGEEAVIHIANAEIRDGSANGGEGFGGNISVIGWGAREFIMKDTLVTGGIGHRAGNIYIGTIKKTINDENLDYSMINVTVSDGLSSYRGSNICIDSDVPEKTIVLNMENCDLIDSSNSTRDNLAVGAGAADQTWCEVTMTGGSIQGGTLTIYGLATLTTHGAKLDQTEHAYSGQLIMDP